MLAVARHASRVLPLLAGLAVVVPCIARADIDLTGSWNVYFSTGPSGVWNITQSGTTLTVTVPGATLTGSINPQTGSFVVYAPPPPFCPTGFLATASADGNAFHGDIVEPILYCPGGIFSCQCLPGNVIGNGSGCRIGTGADCCGDSVVGPTEQCDNGPEPATGCCDATCQARASGITCTSDNNACTNDVCDGAGTCTHPAASAGAPCSDFTVCTADACDGAGTCAHTPVASGTSCEDDGQSCTADTCDASGTCQHTPVASGTACEDDGDICTADTCDASGTCTHPTIDVDGDGVCDAFDPCVAGVALTRARLKIGGIGAPPGDDKLTLKGDMQPAAGPPLDPVGNGLRVVLRDSPGGVFVDAMLPPGAYSTTTHTGWKVRGTGFDFVSPQPVGGAVNRVHLKRPPSLPGVVRLAISGKHGSYATASITTAIEVSVVLSSAAGQCAEMTFQPTSCSTRSGTTTCH